MGCGRDDIPGWNTSRPAAVKPRSPAGALHLRCNAARRRLRFARRAPCTTIRPCSGPGPTCPGGPAPCAPPASPSRPDRDAPAGTSRTRADRATRMRADLLAWIVRGAGLVAGDGRTRPAPEVHARVRPRAPTPGRSRGMERDREPARPLGAGPADPHGVDRHRHGHRVHAPRRARRAAPRAHRRDRRGDPDRRATPWRHPHRACRGDGLARARARGRGRLRHRPGCRGDGPRPARHAQYRRHLAIPRPRRWHRARPASSTRTRRRSSSWAARSRTR